MDSHTACVCGDALTLSPLQETRGSLCWGCLDPARLHVKAPSPSPTAQFSLAQDFYLWAPWPVPYPCTVPRGSRSMKVQVAQWPGESRLAAPVAIWCWQFTQAVFPLPMGVSTHSVSLHRQPQSPDDNSVLQGDDLCALSRCSSHENTILGFF